MTFYPFIEKTNKYLKTVRIIKNYVSFDMVFPESWVIIKKLPENVEILQTETPEGQTLTSFVCQNNKDNKLQEILFGEVLHTHKQFPKLQFQQIFLLKTLMTGCV